MLRKKGLGSRVCVFRSKDKHSNWEAQMQSSTSCPDVETVAQLIGRFFTEDIEALARESGVVQRRSRLDGSTLLQVLVFGFLKHPQLTLKQLAQLCYARGVELTAQGLHSRINAYSVTFLRAMFERGFRVFRSALPLPLPLLQRFTQINIVDSSVVALPEGLQAEYRGCGGSGPKASLKLQLVFDFLRGNVEQLVVQAGRAVDQVYRDYLAVVTPRSLTLADLGYFCLEAFAAIAARGGYFLTRYSYPTAVFTPPGESLALLPMLAHTPATTLTMPILLGAETQLPSRLIALRVPQEVGDVRRRKLLDKVRRGKRKSYSHDYLAFQDWSVWITNVPADLLSAEQARCLYRVRWQIELLFKLWKSSGGLCNPRCVRRDRVLTELYAKMLGLLLCHFLVAPLRVPDDQWADREISAVHARQLLADCAIHLLPSLSDLPTLTQLVAHFQALLLRFGCKEKRKHRPNICQCLVDAEGALA